MYLFHLNLIDRLNQKELEENIRNYEKTKIVDCKLKDIRVSEAKKITFHPLNISVNSANAAYEIESGDFYAPLGITAKHLNYTICKVAEIIKKLDSFQEKYFSKEKMNDPLFAMEHKELNEYFSDMKEMQKSVVNFLDKFISIGIKAIYYANEICLSSLQNNSEIGLLVSQIMSAENNLDFAKNAGIVLSKKLQTKKNLANYSYPLLMEPILTLCALINSITKMPRNLGWRMVSEKNASRFVSYTYKT